MLISRQKTLKKHTNRVTPTTCISKTHFK